VLVVVLAGAFVTYGGVSLFVAFFVLAPMAEKLFRTAEFGFWILLSQRSAHQVAEVECRRNTARRRPQKSENYFFYSATGSVQATFLIRLCNAFEHMPAGLLPESRREQQMARALQQLHPVPKAAIAGDRISKSLKRSQPR
jgi:hypothetical protein